MDKDTRKVLAEAERQGFTVRITRRGHALVRDRDGIPIATFGGTTSDVRGLRNGIAALRRAGFVWPPKK